MTANPIAPYAPKTSPRSVVLLTLAVGLVLFALWVRWYQGRRGAAPAPAPEAERD